jgi:hypothetical protein
VVGTVAGLLVTLMSSRSIGESANTKPVLVELFTSEGCSSCPPADALLRTLDSTQPVPGVQLIVLGEHVDYWDDLGWKDAYASHAFTVRQQAYADRLRLASPYTPQMVVDGNLEFVGSNRQRANQAFEKARVLPKVTVRISSLKIEKGHLRAHVETDPLPSQAEVFVALALEHAQSQVLHGENGGHRLEHVAVARSLASVGKTKKGEAFSRDVSLAADSSGMPYRLVVFLQEPNQGTILGATVERLQK